MAWDSVPWFTEGGAEHSSDVARLLAYASFGGAEGVVGASDLQVRQLSAPAAAVQIRTGACAILNRAPGGRYQAYAGRLPAADEVPVAATGAAKRSDLIVARIENPYSAGETWPNPSDPAVGPYVFTRVISGVPATTTSVRQVRPNDSAIALARIDVPANTSSITQSMIKDLRTMVNPRRERRLYTAFPSTYSQITYTDDKWKNWPAEARWDMEIPEWATRGKLVTTFAGLRMSHAYVYGVMQNALGSLWVGQDTVIDDDQGTGIRRITAVLADNWYIPPSIRGTVQTLRVQTRIYKNHPGVVAVDGATSMIADAEFVEAPTEDEV